MKSIKQAGFTITELLIVLGFLLCFGVVGYVLYLVITALRVFIAG